MYNEIAVMQEPIVRRFVSVVATPTSGNYAIPLLSASSPSLAASLSSVSQIRVGFGAVDGRSSLHSFLHSLVIVCGLAVLGVVICGEGRLPFSHRFGVVCLLAIGRVMVHNKTLHRVQCSASHRIYWGRQDNMGYLPGEATGAVATRVARLAIMIGAI